MKKVGVVALALTLLTTIPALFVLSRKTVSPNQFIVIAGAVLMLVLWIIVYVTLIDPLLRRSVGALFNRTIQWRGSGKSLAWTPTEKTGCLSSLFIDLLGYVFIILWLLPYAAGIAFIWWLRR